jgi:CheY-like chemotaxis protein
MASNQQKILIVEDEADTAEMLAEMVRLSGYQVECTYSGKTAISMLTNLKPDLVLLDIVMPGISGLDVLNFMRYDPRLISIPVIIISSNSLPSDKQICMDAGASEYLTKPVSYTDLKEAIEKALHP